MAAHQGLETRADALDGVAGDLLWGLLHQADYELQNATDDQYLDFVQAGAQAALAADLDADVLQAWRTVVTTIIQTRIALTQNATTTIPSIPVSATHEPDDLTTDGPVPTRPSSITTSTRSTSGETAPTVITGDIRDAHLDAIDAARNTDRGRRLRTLLDLSAMRRDILTQVPLERPTVSHPAGRPPPPSAVPGVNAWAAYARDPPEEVPEREDIEIEVTVGDESFGENGGTTENEGTTENGGTTENANDPNTTNSSTELGGMTEVSDASPVADDNVTENMPGAFPSEEQNEGTMTGWGFHHVAK